MRHPDDLPMKHMWFIMFPEEGGHAYGHYLHGLVMDDIELGPRISNYEDQVVICFGISGWLEEVLGTCSIL